MYRLLFEIQIFRKIPTLVYPYQQAKSQCLQTSTAGLREVIILTL